MSEEQRSKRIAELNDQFRKSLWDPLLGLGPQQEPPVPGIAVMTAGVNALPDPMKLLILQRVHAFDEFIQDNDPYGEHDFGIIRLEGVTVYWKFDYYDNDLQYGSEDPSDPSVTMRVLTILLPEEY